VIGDFKYLALWYRFLHILYVSNGKTAMPAPPAQDFARRRPSPPANHNNNEGNAFSSKQPASRPCRTLGSDQPCRISSPRPINKEMTHGQSEKRCDEMRMMDD
jgi:hypothetical protein